MYCGTIASDDDDCYYYHILCAHIVLYSTAREHKYYAYANTIQVYHVLSAHGVAHEKRNRKKQYRFDCGCSLVDDLYSEEKEFEDK